MACDLHCHTRISDGSMGIEELITLSKRRGLSAISVTDHDTTAGATRAVVIGRRQEMTVVHGVEFSTRHKASGQKAHLLCYACETPDRLEKLCRRISELRKKASTDMVRRVMRYYPISPDMVVRCASGSTNIYKQHIMHALMDAGYTDSIYGDVYNKLFGTQGAARVEIDYPDTLDVLAEIHDAGGIAVLAHPAIYQNECIVEELSAAGLDGLEIWHPAHDEKTVIALEALADANGLLKTGGSDFHGMYSRSIRPLGCVTAPDECLQALLSFKAKRTRGAV